MVHDLSDMCRCALTIAGSDPSGGAGIQVDLKTFAATGVYGMAVITALTAQNAARVSGAQILDSTCVSKQVSVVLEDMVPGAVKTGMLATSSIIETVVHALPKGVPLVVDPVMISTSGHRLLDMAAVRSVRDILIPRATLVTPNIPEAEVLCAFEIVDEEGMQEAGMQILTMGAFAVVVKGGHGSGDESIDLLISRQGVVSLRSVRMPYSVHGSGCCFSAAITGYLALGFPMEEACQMGKILVSRAIEQAVCGISGMRMVNPGGF
jgi:hydroxymethylpyrimidine/phosphomethylpyrimidine kinase